jgi:serine protease
MKTHKSLLSILLVSFSILVKAQESTIVPGNLLVMVNSDAEAQQLSDELQSLYGIQTDFKIERTLSKSMHIYLYDFNSNTINQDLILKAVRRNHLVKIAQFNHKFQERIIPNDTQFASMWDMNNTGATGGTPDADIDAPEAWDITTGGLTAQGDTIVVAAIDGGYDLAHVDLNFWKNYNEIPSNGIDDDGNGYIDDVKGWNAGTNSDAIPSAAHGTHLSGSIGARGNNGIGVTGVNWNVKVMAVSYGSTSGDSALEANAVESYAYVRDQRRLYNQTNGAKGAFVVSTNSSFGIDNGQPINFPMWCAMYDSLGAVGIISAAATANHNWNIDVVGDIPTACTSNWLVSVTNTTNLDQKYTNAGYGATTIDIGAPGTNITSTIPGNSYGTMTGTSMATPHIAGTIALMYSLPCSQFIINCKADPAGVALIVKDSMLGAVDLLSDFSAANFSITSHGRLNLHKSVMAMQNYCAAVGIDENDATVEFGIKNIYPNPATNNLNVIYYSSETTEISITNLLGQEIKRIKGDSSKGMHTNAIDVSTINKGIYFVTIFSTDHVSNVLKVVID